MILPNDLDVMLNSFLIFISDVWLTARPNQIGSIGLSALLGRLAYLICLDQLNQPIQPDPRPFNSVSS